MLAHRPRRRPRHLPADGAALKVCNGTHAKVQVAEPTLGITTLQPDGGPIRQLSARDVAEHLEHGDALNGHTAQRRTIDRASLVLMRSEGALAECGYVATSRARAVTRLYVAGPEFLFCTRRRLRA